LTDDDLVTQKEALKLLQYHHTSFNNLFNANKRYYKRGLYPILLTDYIQRIDVKHLTNKCFFYKKDLVHIKDFIEWFERAKEVRKQQAEYKRTMRKYYGDINATTKQCIISNFDCMNCPQCEICKNYKCDVSLKQFAKMVKFLFGNKKRWEDE
jgi:hypothetical protein